MGSKLTFCGDVWVPKFSEAKFNCAVTDLLIINLEAPITDNFEDRNQEKICLATDASKFENAFKEKMPFAVCLANNHILDFGESGYEDTVEYLKKKGILYFGAGSLEEYCNNPLLIEVGKENVALLGYVCESTHPVVATDRRPGVALLDPQVVKRDIERSREMGATRIVLNIHWGEEEVSIPRPDDISRARQLAAYGVDLIIGHHAHCALPFTVFEKTHIFFGLGNALFPDFTYTFPNGGVAWSKQRHWNKRSIVVDYDPIANDCEYSFVKDLSLKNSITVCSVKKKVDAKAWTLQVDAAAYSRRYLKARRFGHTRLAMSRFIARPRFPSLSKLMWFLRYLAR